MATVVVAIIIFTLWLGKSHVPSQSLSFLTSTMGTVIWIASSTFTKHSHGLGLLPLLFHPTLVRRWGRVYQTPFPQAWRHIKPLIFGQGDPELYVGLKSFIPHGIRSGESLFWILRNEEFKMVKAKASWAHPFLCSYYKVPPQHLILGEPPSLLHHLIPLTGRC